MPLKILFLLIAACSLIFIFIGTSRNKNIFPFAIWQIMVALAAYNGYFLRYPILFPGIMIISLSISFWVLSRVDISKVNLQFLLLLHVLRIPVEYALLLLYQAHKIPVEMTFLGWNFDILIGIIAFFMMIYQWITTRKISRNILIIWNFMGLLFLLFIVSIAILSSPLPVQQFGFENPNIAVLEFPFFLLPTCIVPMVLISHLLFLKILFKKNWSKHTEKSNIDYTDTTSF